MTYIGVDTLFIFMVFVSLFLLVLFLISFIGIIFPRLLNWFLIKFDRKWVATRKVALIMSIILFFMVAITFGIADAFNPDPNKYKDKNSTTKIPQPKAPTVKKTKLVKKVVQTKPTPKPLVTAKKQQTHLSKSTPKPNPIKKSTPPTTVKKTTPAPSTPKEQNTASPKTAYYANCKAAKAAGAAPLYQGEPGYRSGLDRDKDGVACDK